MDTALEIDFSVALNAAVDGIEEAQLTLYRLYAAALARAKAAWDRAGGG